MIFCCTLKRGDRKNKLKKKMPFLKIDWILTFSIWLFSFSTSFAFDRCSKINCLLKQNSFGLEFLRCGSSVCLDCPHVNTKINDSCFITQQFVNGVVARWKYRQILISRIFLKRNKKFFDPLSKSGERVSCANCANTHQCVDSFSWTEFINNEQFCLPVSRWRWRQRRRRPRTVCVEVNFTNTWTISVTFLLFSIFFIYLFSRLLLCGVTNAQQFVFTHFSYKNYDIFFVNGK